MVMLTLVLDVLCKPCWCLGDVVNCLLSATHPRHTSHHFYHLLEAH